MSDTAQDPLVEAAAEGMLKMIGITNEADYDAFEEKSNAVAAAMISAGLAAATGTDEADNDEVAVNTYDMAVVAYAADKADTFLTESLQKAVAKQAMNNLLGGLMEAMLGDNAA